ncbi:hypothetical protein C0995_014379, partial [Termitomyces sp. Mi166
MTVGGALAISQPLRNHFREMVTPKRITNANMVTISEIPDDGTDDALPFPEKSPPGTSANHSNANSLSANVTELEGTVGMVDPVEAFYSHWPPEHHTSLCITKNTNLLRAIMVVIDGKEEVECIVDSRSQIVSMSEEIAHHLGLVYDPMVVLNMQSANGAIDQSRGLARNVPCTIAGLTIYLQVHIISQPAYDILLGKPFDVLTRSVVRTLSAHETVITITNPNSGNSRTIATFERGRHKRKPPLPMFFLTDSEPPKCPFHAPLDYDYQTKDFLVVDYAYLDDTIFGNNKIVDSKLPTLALSADNPALACLYLTASKIFNSYVQENTKNKDSLLVTDSLALGHIPWRQRQQSPYHNVYAPTLLGTNFSSAAPTADVFKADAPKCKGVQTKKKYKPVALKVKPVAGTVPEDFHVERDIKEDPLADMPPLNPNPPPFLPTGRFTEERK